MKIILFEIPKSFKMLNNGLNNSYYYHFIKEDNNKLIINQPCTENAQIHLWINENKESDFINPRFVIASHGENKEEINYDNIVFSEKSLKKNILGYQSELVYHLKIAK